MAAPTEVDWIECRKIPHNYFGIPVMTNNNEIIMAACNTLYYVESLIRYDHVADKFTTIMDLKNKLCDKFHDDVVASRDSIAIDKPNNIIYLPYGNSGGGIMKIDLNTNEVDTKKIPRAKEYGIDNDPACIVIDDILHIFGYFDEDNVHTTFNTKTGEIHKTTFSIDNGLEFGLGESIAYIESKNQILFTGGDLENHLLQFDIKMKEFSLIDTQNVTFSWSVCVSPPLLVTPDHKYMIVIGYQDDDFGGIEVYDIERHRILDKSIKLPVGYDSDTRAVLIDDFAESSVVVNGYLRTYRKEIEVKNLNELPLELINVITTFYTQQYLHIMDIIQGLHHKVLLDEIVGTKNFQ